MNKINKSVHSDIEECYAAMHPPGPPEGEPQLWRHLGPTKPHLEAQALLVLLGALRGGPVSHGGRVIRVLSRLWGRTQLLILGLRLRGRPTVRVLPQWLLLLGLPFVLDVALLGARLGDCFFHRHLSLSQLGFPGLRRCRPLLSVAGLLLARRDLHRGGEATEGHRRVHGDSAPGAWGPPGAGVAAGLAGTGPDLGARSALSKLQRAAPERALHRGVAARVHLHRSIAAADRPGTHPRQQGHELRPPVAVEVLGGGELPAAGKEGRGRGPVTPGTESPTFLGLVDLRVGMRAGMRHTRREHVCIPRLSRPGSHQRGPAVHHTPLTRQRHRREQP